MNTANMQAAIGLWCSLEYEGKLNSTTERELHAALGWFVRHYFKAKPGLDDIDTCDRCGHDLRSEIHFRSGE